MSELFYLSIINKSCRFRSSILILESFPVLPQLLFCLSGAGQNDSPGTLERLKLKSMDLA